jgi:serine/threonine protein kinase/tetratricopeptide (TPR) repeat protein
MTPTPQRVRELFLAAVRRPAAEREAYLAEACAGDDDLHREAHQLLNAHAAADSFLESPAPDLDAIRNLSQIPESAGTVIGPYQLLEQIGEGGFGVVFMAEQTSPVRRKVALKVLKPGMDTRQVVARFEAERQALAVMDHPNIAKVHDGGETETGRPYFVMELVKGVPITEFCDRNRLTLRERLELFISVCGAVQHAHQKGVIHRDLKPSNVLVSRHDTQPVVKVIDFGVAKALGQELTDGTLFTGVAQMIGTPLYMSPEQAGMSDLDVDTRSDIYSLGVLLYELLTGTTPFSSERFKNAGYDQIRRIIREEEPPRPSTRLSALSPAADTVSSGRGSNPRGLSRLVRGELDWIVMKALEKDRSRRYETANAFAADVHRYLCGEAVQAVPPSAWYRFRKLARRNRGAFTAAGGGLLVLILATAGLAANNWLVAREKKQKEAALDNAVAEKKRADENLIRARKAVKEYLFRVTENPRLNSADFFDLRKELLNAAIPFYREFVRQHQSDPELEAERAAAYVELGTLRLDVGELDGALADVREAEAIFARLAGTHPDQPAFRRGLAEATNTRGVILDKQGQFGPAEAAFREALGMIDRLATEHPQASEYRESLARAAGNLGDLLKDLDRPDAADAADAALRRSIKLREELVAARPEKRDVRSSLAQSWVNLGALEVTRRRVPQAEAAFKSALDILNAVPDPSAKDRQVEAQAWNNLGVLYRSSGRTDEAEKAARKALAAKEELVDRFPSVPQFRLELAQSWSNLGVVLHKTTRRKGAQDAYEKSIAIYERLRANSDVPQYAIGLAGTCVNLGRLIGDNGNLEESLPVLTKGIEILEPAVRKDPELAKARESLCFAYWLRATTLAGLKRFPQAVSDWGRAIELDDGHNAVLLRIKRASTLLNLKDHVRAAADAQAVAESDAATGQELFQAASVFAYCVRFAGKDSPEAESYARRAVATLRKAADKGFRDAARLKSSADLEPLRSREDFRKLIAELEESKQKSWFTR